MMRRILIASAFLLVSSSVLRGQANCSTGSYNYGDYQNSQTPCTTVQPQYVTLTWTRTANEWCTAGAGANIPQGTVYWNAVPPSTDVGYGQRACPGIVGFPGPNAVDCWPRMVFYETNGGQPYPNNTISDTYANRFFNQGYDHAFDIIDFPVTCIEVAPKGSYSSQDFKQCTTQQCQVHSTCCKCPQPPTAKLGEDTFNKFFLSNVQNCQAGYSQTCCGSTPIIIDTTGNGFALTNAANGVKFDISGQGNPIQIGWTAPGSGNAFLCLPDATGACDDGRDLFGSNTPQPPSDTPNGFAALAVYDDPAHGGGGYGVIDSRNGVFSRLRLWIDANHDGVSQPNEIFTLPQLGITSISLNYKWDQRTDQYGNVFRYRAQIGRTDGGTRMAYDVFFVTAGGMTTAQACTPPQPALLKNDKALFK